MAVGLEIYDASGVLQVSSTMFGFFCRKSGTVTSTARVNGNTNPSSLSISITGYTRPIIAFQTTATVAFSGLSGSTMTFASSAAIGTVVQYYIFDISSAMTSAPGAGLQVYDATGNLVFTSAQYPMQILARITTTTGTVTFAGSSLAFAPLNYAGARNHGSPLCYDSGGPAIYTSSCALVKYHNIGSLHGANTSADLHTATGSSVSYDDVLVTYGPAPWVAPPNYDTAITTLVCDVTNIPASGTFF
jgi:hypothetical protein